MKRILILLLAMTLMLSLVSCGDISEDEAKAKTEELIKCVSENRFDDAKALLHPSRSSMDLASIFERAEREYGVDFQSSIEISRYTDLSCDYEDEIDGDEFEVDVDIIVSGMTLEMSVSIVKNDAGFGIYSVEIDD